MSVSLDKQPKRPKIDYTRPVKVDGRTGFAAGVCSVDAVGYESVPVVRGPVREFFGMLAPAGLVMLALAFVVLLTGCGPDESTDKPQDIALTSDDIVASGNVNEWSVPRKDWPKSAGVPECEHEDGSSQEVCWWYDSANGTFVNMGHGRYTYVTATGDMLDYGPNDNRK